MKIQKTWVFLSVMLLGAIPCMDNLRAEELSSRETEKQLTRWEYYDQYARWSLGANIGLPFFRGNFQSNAYNKLYWGFMPDIQVGYQFTPLIGGRFNIGYAQAKTGAKSYEQDYWLDKYGWADYRVTPLDGSMQYKDLYSKVRLLDFALHADINLNNLFSPEKSSGHRWTVFISPGIYFQKFFSDIYTKSDDKQFSREHYNPLTVGLGGEAMLRWKVAKSVDLQARYGINWIHQNNFDGIECYRPRNNSNFMTHFSVGVVWKIKANTKKKDHLVYAPRYVAPPKERVIDTVVVKMEPVIVERVVEKEVEKPVWYQMPHVYFLRGSSEIDTEVYAKELKSIVNLLKAMKDVKISIYGYGDHTGSDSVNERLTQERAEAMRDYLTRNGISESRIEEVKGMGKDKMLLGEEAYSIKARRVEIVR